MDTKFIKDVENAIALLSAAIDEERQQQKHTKDFAPLCQQLKERRLLLKSLGYKTNIDNAYISRIENGLLNPNLKSLIEIANAYDCHLELIPNN